MNIKDRLTVFLYLIQFSFHFYVITSIKKLYNNHGSLIMFVVFSCIIFGIVIWRLLVLRNVHISAITSNLKIHDNSMKLLSKKEIRLFSILCANPGLFGIALILIVNNFLKYRNYTYENIKKNDDLMEIDVIPDKLVSNIYVWLLSIPITMGIALPIWVCRIFKMYYVNIAKIIKEDDKVKSNYGYSLLDEILFALYAFVGFAFIIRLTHIDIWVIEKLKSF